MTHAENLTTDSTSVQLSPVIPPPENNKIILRLAQTPEEIKAAQRLRYKIFYQEFNVAAPPEVESEERDFDEYDVYADHLVVIDESILNPSDQIVGTYRLFRRANMPDNLSFFSAHEFDIDALIKNGGKVLELGRSCVLPEYRTKYVMQRLWQGIAEYLSIHQIDLMFGCASFHEKDPYQIINELSYLHHFHRPPENLHVTAKLDGEKNIPLKAKEELDARRIFAGLPALIKGYLRLGAYIGEGYYIDKNLDHIDVCIILPTQTVTGKYMKHYDRKIQKPS